MKWLHLSCIYIISTISDNKLMYTIIAMYPLGFLASWVAAEYLSGADCHVKPLESLRLMYLHVSKW